MRGWTSGWLVQNRKFTLLIIQLLVLISNLETLPPVIKIGVVLSEEHRGSSFEFAFKYAIYRINKDPGLLSATTLVYDLQYVSKEDSFHAGKKVCSMIRSGALAIFGPCDPVLSSHVQSICNALDIPHLEAWLDTETDLKRFSINLFPSNRLLNQAYSDMIHFLNWTKVAIIYRDEYGFLKLQGLVHKPPKGRRLEFMMRQGEPANYRQVLMDIKRSDFYNVIVDTGPEDMTHFLTSILQLQMNDYSYHYFFTTFNLETFDMDHFKYNYVNITSLRIVDMDNPIVLQILHDMNSFQSHGERIHNWSHIIQAESAIIYDSVHVLAHGLQSLDMSTTLQISNATCDEESPWSDGSSLFNYLNSVEFAGLSGQIQFKEGRRSDLKLDIIKLRQETLQKVGEWTPSNGVNITNSMAYYQEGQPNITLIVTTILQTPYVMLKKDENVTGNERFEGFCIDLLSQISKSAGFNYILDLVPDGIYGVQNAESNEWNGMMRQLLDKKADLAMASLTINYAREKVVDFTKPFLNLGIGILFKVPNAGSDRLFTFMNPLAMEIWLYVLGAYILVSLTMFTVARFSPYEWRNPHPFCGAMPDVVENQFSLSNSFWFTIGTLMQQGSDPNPKAASTRIVGGIWWFFTLIIISSYTANLAAFLTVERMTSPIEDVDDLASQNEISYGALAGGSTMTFFRDSKMEVYQKMWRFMKAQKSLSILTSYDEGIERVLNGNYAFLMESTMLDYFIQRDCNLTQIGGNLDSKGYGIATQMGSPWRDKISLAILELQENGVVQELYNWWWKNSGKNCRRDDKNKESKANALNMTSVGGVFVVLCCGLAIAIVVSLLEFYWNSRKNAQAGKQPLCAAIAEELRFAVQCPGSRHRAVLTQQRLQLGLSTSSYVPESSGSQGDKGIVRMPDLQETSVYFDYPEY